MRPRPGANEWPLVFFTVLTQAAAGTAAATAAIGATTRTLPLVSLAFLTAGVLAATAHLGRPAAARFAIANLRTSWLSRETAFAALFGATLILAAIAPKLAIVPAITGLLLVAAIAKLYMIRTVPAWDTWATPATFFATMILLGAAITVTVHVLTGTTGADSQIRWLGVAAAAAAGAQICIALIRRRPVDARRLLTLAIGAAVLLAAAWPTSIPHHPVEFPTALAVLFLSELFGRHIFYVSHRRLGL